MCIGSSSGVLLDNTHVYLRIICSGKCEKIYLPEIGPELPWVLVYVLTDVVAPLVPGHFATHLQEGRLRQSLSSSYEGALWL
jgi:hypothetical protein